MTDRKKPGVAFWATVTIVVVAIYIASFGPACWWFASRDPASILIGDPHRSPRYAPRVYWPIGWLAENGPLPIGDAIFWYADTGSEGSIMLPTASSGDRFYDSSIHSLVRMFRR